MSERGVPMEGRRAGLRLLVPAVALLVTGVLAMAGCHSTVGSEVRVVSGASPNHGKQAIKHYGCGSCHEIPGVAGAHGLVGPPLEKFGLRGYIAGELRNTANNLAYWIQNPKTVEPGTDMPDLGVTPQAARDITAYLYTLR